jgi:5-formyltetrahydrofolate cyclo-ligase
LTGDLKKEKSEFRRAMLARRAAMTPDAHARANQRMLQDVTALPEYHGAQTVFLFISVADEPDTSALIEDAWRCGKQVCVPRCISLGVMQACVIRSRDDLQNGRYDIPEPKDDRPLVSPDEIDLTIVPCVCCDRDGYRLGYGGGFYDRWLEERTAPVVALCFGEMVVPAVPREPHDQKVDVLISDAIFSPLRFQ